MARIRDRDVQAFEELYERFKYVVYGIGSRMLGSDQAAEDVVQAVFMKVWSRPEAFREGNLTAWMARVTRNHCLDALRSRANRSETPLQEDVPLESAVDDEIFARIDGDRVRTALARLPEEERTPIEMGFFEGATHVEIASRTGIPLGTIKSRIRKGLRRLREQLEGVVVT
jgi:RNA polymerase sigma-70 factor (ECF subfamily)